MTLWKKAMCFGVVHFLLQLFVYVSGFAFGPAIMTRKLIGLSLYDVAVIITLPFVYLAERFKWKGLGIVAFQLNSIIWAGAFYLILLAMRKLLNKRD